MKNWLIAHLRDELRHSRRKRAWPAMMMFKFHKPVNCPAQRLLPAAIVRLCAHLVITISFLGRITRTVLESELQEMAPSWFRAYISSPMSASGHENLKYLELATPEIPLG